MKLIEWTIGNNLMLFLGRNKILKRKLVILIVFRQAEKALLTLMAHHCILMIHVENNFEISAHLLLVTEEHFISQAPPHCLSILKWRQHKHRQFQFLNLHSFFIETVMNFLIFVPVCVFQLGKLRGLFFFLNRFLFCSLSAALFRP